MHQAQGVSERPSRFSGKVGGGVGQIVLPQGKGIAEQLKGE
jgi:hypothetical protein